MLLLSFLAAKGFCLGGIERAEKLFSRQNYNAAMSEYSAIALDHFGDLAGEKAALSLGIATSGRVIILTPRANTTLL